MHASVQSVTARSSDLRTLKTSVPLVVVSTATTLVQAVFCSTGITFHFNYYGGHVVILQCGFNCISDDLGNRSHIIGHLDIFVKTCGFISSPILGPLLLFWIRVFCLLFTWCGCAHNLQLLAVLFIMVFDQSPILIQSDLSKFPLYSHSFKKCFLPTPKFTSYFLADSFSHSHEDLWYI